MSRGTKLRNVRIDDALWQAARSRAEAEGRTMSDVIRAYLRRYVSR